jgi:hypothetical protein
VTTGTETGEGYRERLRAAGITPDRPTSRPLFDLLNDAHEDRRAIRAALDRIVDPLEAAEKISTAIVVRTGSKLASWACRSSAGVTALLVVVAFGVGYAVGRHGLAVDAARVENGLGAALALPAAASYLEIMRNNRDGLVVEKVVGVERGGEVAVGRWWKTLPQPAVQR